MNTPRPSYQPNDINLSVPPFTYSSTPSQLSMNIPLTPLRFLRHAERQFSTRTAVVDRTYRATYAEFANRAARLAGALLAAGTQPGDRIAFLSTNSHQLLEAYYGVLDAHAILLPLNIRLAPAELAYILADATATTLFLEPQFLPVVAALLPSVPTLRKIHLIEGSPDTATNPWLSPQTYESLIAAAAPHHADIDQIDEDAICEIFYTSGTSSRPKGVALTHRNVYLHAYNSALGGSIQNGSVEMHSIPLFHANGWGIAHFLTVTGGKHVMLRAFDPVELFRLIQTERVENFRGVPIMITVLVNHPARLDYDLSSLKSISIGGAAPSPTLIRQAEQALGCEVYTGYGLTETSPTLCTSRNKSTDNATGDQRYVAQSLAGYPYPGTRLKIVDAEDNFLPEDGVTFGELVTRSDGVMHGYWNQPEATAEAFRNGWFHTGDMATINPEGYVALVDRKKDIIISGGENISSLEVENTLLAHPAVLEAAVIPVSHERWGEVPKALIVLKPNHTLTAPELIAHARATLAGYKCPAYVQFVEILPKTGTGKVLKKDLRTQYGHPS